MILAVGPLPEGDVEGVTSDFRIQAWHSPNKSLEGPRPGLVSATLSTTGRHDFLDHRLRLCEQLI